MAGIGRTCCRALFRGRCCWARCLVCKKLSFCKSHIWLHHIIVCAVHVGLVRHVLHSLFVGYMRFVVSFLWCKAVIVLCRTWFASIATGHSHKCVAVPDMFAEHVQVVTNCHDSSHDSGAHLLCICPCDFMTSQEELYRVLFCGHLLAAKALRQRIWGRTLYGHCSAPNGKWGFS